MSENNPNTLIGYVLLAPFDRSERTTAYRGLARRGPEDVFGEEGSVERTLWMRSADMGGDGEYSVFIATLEDGQVLQKEYSALGRSYDLVEFTLCRSSKDAVSQKANGIVLGFDVANMVGESLLDDGPPLWPQRVFDDAEEKGEACLPVWILQHQYFSARLNVHQLLDTYNDADLLLCVERYLAATHPSLDLYDAADAEIFYLRLITP